MPGPVPGIHDISFPIHSETWMAGTSPAMTDASKPELLAEDAFVEAVAGIEQHVE